MLCVHVSLPGSDMSQFVIEAGVARAKTWVVCIDLESQRAEVSLLLIVDGANVGAADAAVRIADDGVALPVLVTQLAEKLAPAGVGAYLDEITAAVVGPAAAAS